MTQAQFAGYYAAQKQGYYKKAGLDVKIKVGGPNITPEQVVASGQARVRARLAAEPVGDPGQGHRPRQHRAGLRQAGMTELTWKSSRDQHDREDEGQEGRVWFCGNELELFAALTKNGIDPNNSSDVTIVNQPFDMNLFLQQAESTRRRR